MSCVMSSGPGRAAVRMAAASGACSQAGPPSRASKLSGPSPSTTTSWRSAGSEGCSARAMASWSKPRNTRGTTSTRASPWRSMNESSRSRKIGISGLITAPMREQARYIRLNCHQLGSCMATTSSRRTPRRCRPTAMRSASWPTSRQVKRRVSPDSTRSAVSASLSGQWARQASSAWLMVWSCHQPRAMLSARRGASRTASNSMAVSSRMEVWAGLASPARSCHRRAASGARVQAGTALRPARVRAMTVFMICAVPSPIWKPSTSRRRCSIRPRS